MDIKNFLPGDDEKINMLLKFTAEVDKMTSVIRHTSLIDMSRNENDAEHSWHIALMAILFKDYAPEGCDIGRAVKMCIVHDLIEIYAGDTFAYDAEANKGKEEREKIAADRLFGQLPVELGKELRDLWEEFDRMDTPDSRYAAAMDRLQPFLHNTLTEGHTWKEGHPSIEMVNKRIAPAIETIPQVKSWYDLNIERAVKEGWLKK
ncbi:MAG: HD domain-containing protein [Treponema sp.]|uniref:HD domain-containing protein n=1 Tax=Treponema sp. TaxID=166 RepID=UPI00298E82EA|nr:HD domain-containing protein [Treponema sp.]MCQ2599836.1 HD domain-containing protein [Treponema sp.]